MTFTLPLSPLMLCASGTEATTILAGAREAARRKHTMDENNLQLVNFIVSRGLVDVKWSHGAF